MIQGEMELSMSRYPVPVPRSSAKIHIWLQEQVSNHYQMEEKNFALMAYEAFEKSAEISLWNGLDKRWEAIVCMRI